MFIIKFDTIFVLWPETFWAHHVYIYKGVITLNSEEESSMFWRYGSFHRSGGKANLVFETLNNVKNNIFIDFLTW